jgi:ABC-type nitrate/sulfonate/bicarbonate transport system substrate-binding protein
MGVFIHFGGPFAAETIRVVYSSVNPHALLVSMAEKRGLYAKYGLASTIVYVSGGSTAIQAMVSGDVDLAQLTGPPGVAANLRGADLVYFAMTDDRMGYQLVTRPEIKSASELKGKRFAISRFASSADFGARALLRRLGVDPKDVTILQIGNEADRLAALRSGSVDGSVFNAPFGALAKKFNFNILADAGALGIPYFNTGICGSAKLLQKNEGKILNFLRAYLETIKMLVSIGLGWSVLPLSMIHGKELRVLKLPGIKLQRTLGVVHHRARTLSNAARAMVELLINRA